ncbi:MAG: BppU family phage baseplate upper protein [Lachnospiraceae bacterium]|nr:BppU family phage baseplate upper protein [Lachnospiraceae bacterium]
MNNIQNLSMDIMDNHMYEVIYAKQYDEGRTIIFNILENGRPFDISGYKAIFQMKKPDGTVIINDYDVTNGEIAISLTNQMTICAGNKIPFQIQLIKNIEDLNEKPIILTTVTGYIKVDKSVVQPDDAVSSNEFNALTHALTEVNKLHVEITNAEKVREENENIRENNETLRVLNETLRNNEEEIRKANETIRISSETIRSQNEETRQSNENIRKSNEITRQSDTADAIAQANTATKNCVDATTDLQTKLNENYFVLTSDKGIANGVAELDQNGLVPSSQLPGYVDDVIEGYFNDDKFYKDSAFLEDIEGETGKIYVDLETNKTYRWSGNTFIVISETLALGETSSTAYRGDKGKEAFEHSLSTHARIDATKTEKSDINGNIKINDEEKLVYKHPVSGATVGSYGDVVDQTPNAGESFKVPFISVDDAGHITEVNEHTITLPESFIDGDTANNTVTYTSEDNLTANAWTDVAALTSGEKHSSIFNKVSKMFKNVRYIWKLLGTTDISTIGNGTITGAVNSLNGDLANTNTAINTLSTGLNNANTAIGKKQDASTAITTSNIGSQSVNYANSAGSANNSNHITATTGQSMSISYSGLSDVPTYVLGVADGNTTDIKLYTYKNHLGAKLTSNTNAFEMNGGTGVTRGTYIDFHYDGGTSDYTQRIIASNASGNLIATPGISNSSDKRLKNDIEELDNVYIDIIKELKPVQYRYKHMPKQLRLGFIAQEVDDILNKYTVIDKPLVEKVTGMFTKDDKVDESEYYALDYNQFIPIAIKAIQDLYSEIDNLKSK